MKKLKLAILLVIGMLAIESHSHVVSYNKLTNFPEITFDKTTHDFGKITEGEIVMFTFKFSNTGKSPLLISNIHTDSPSCTVLNDWKSTPIHVNEVSEFTVIYNSKNKEYKQFINIILTCNTEREEEIVNLTTYVSPDKKPKTNKTNDIKTAGRIHAPTYSHNRFDTIKNETISSEKELMKEAYDRMVVEISIDEASRIEREILRDINIELDIKQKKEKRVKRKKDITKKIASLKEKKEKRKQSNLKKEKYRKELKRKKKKKILEIKLRKKERQLAYKKERARIKNNKLKEKKNHAMLLAWQTKDVTKEKEQEAIALKEKIENEKKKVIKDSDKENLANSKANNTKKKLKPRGRRKSTSRMSKRAVKKSKKRARTDFKIERINNKIATLQKDIMQVENLISKEAYKLRIESEKGKPAPKKIEKVKNKIKKHEKHIKSIHEKIAVLKADLH